MSSTPDTLAPAELDPLIGACELETYPGEVMERRIAHGEFDARGKRVAFHVTRDPRSLDRIRLPAENVCHVFRVEHPSQVRGLSFSTPVLLRLADLDKWVDAQVVRQQVAALVCGFITNQNAEPVPFEPDE